MKKLILLLLAFCLVIPMTYADKTAEKKAEKEKKEQVERARKIAKTLKKDGWKLQGGTLTLEEAVLRHHDKIRSMYGGREIVGFASNVKNQNVGHQKAMTDAYITYSQQEGGKIKGGIEQILGTDANEELDKFYAHYERLVEKEIKGEMQETFTIIREKSPGIFEFQTYFVVNEQAAANARMRAVESALKESEIAQKHTEEIKKFVKEGFVIE